MLLTLLPFPCRAPEFPRPRPSPSRRPSEPLRPPGQQPHPGPLRPAAAAPPSVPQEGSSVRPPAAAETFFTFSRWKVESRGKRLVPDWRIACPPSLAATLDLAQHCPSVEPRGTDASPSPRLSWYPEQEASGASVEDPGLGL